MYAIYSLLLFSPLFFFKISFLLGVSTILCVLYTEPEYHVYKDTQLKKIDKGSDRVKIHIVLLKTTFKKMCLKKSDLFFRRR